MALAMVRMYAIVYIFTFVACSLLTVSVSRFFTQISVFLYFTE